MKQHRYIFILAIFFQIILFENSKHVWAKDYELFWLEKTLPTEEIFEFAKLSEDQMIDALREKYGVHVVIVPDPDGVKNPNMTRGNLKEEEEFLTYYYAFKEAVKGLSATIIKERDGIESDAHYVRPYCRLPDLDLNNDRPIIWINESIDKTSIIHEYMHFYIDQVLLSRSPIERDGKLYHPSYIKTIEAREARRQFIDARINFEKDPKNLKEALAMAEKVIQLYMEYDHDTLQEEMDVYQFMYENRNQFGLSEEKAELYLRIIGYYVNNFFKGLKVVIGLGDKVGNDAVPWIDERGVDEVMRSDGPEDHDPDIWGVVIRAGRAVDRVQYKIRTSAQYVNRELKAMGKPPYFRFLDDAVELPQEK